MIHWTPLWSMIVDSSIWSEPDYVCKIFVTMLALKDSDDVCRYNAYQLAQRAHKTEQEVLDALRVLASPDSRRIEQQEHEGRRIKAVQDGWLILNGQKYREMVSIQMKRARWRRAKAEARKKAEEEKKKGNPKYSPTAAERIIEKGIREGTHDVDGNPINPA